MAAQGDWHGVRERVEAMVATWHRAGGAGWLPSDSDIFERPLAEREMAEIEAQYGVTLPSDYRSFLMEVGNGGIGPWTTHLPSEDLNASDLSFVRRMAYEGSGLESGSPNRPSMPGEWGWVWQELGFHWKPDLSGPFVNNDEWPGKQVETLRAAGHKPGPPNHDTGYLDAYISAFGDADDTGYERFNEERHRGSLQVCSFGCGMTGWLVVIGPHRGEIRWRDASVNPAFEPEVDRDSTPHTFHTWYMDWLTCQEATLGIRS